MGYPYRRICYIDRRMCYAYVDLCYDFGGIGWGINGGRSPALAKGGVFLYNVP